MNPNIGRHIVNRVLVLSIFGNTPNICWILSLWENRLLMYGDAFIRASTKKKSIANSLSVLHTKTVNDRETYYMCKGRPSPK